MAWKCPECGEANEIGDIAKCAYCGYKLRDHDELSNIDFAEKSRINPHGKYRKQSKGGIYAVILSSAGIVLLLVFWLANRVDGHQNDFGLYLFPISLILSFGGIMTALYNLDPGDASARLGLGLGVIYFLIVGGFYFLVRFMFPSF